MTAVREIMSPQATHVTVDDTLVDAARLMADLDLGALPIRDDGRLAGMITDRDIVVSCVAQGRDPLQVKVGEFAVGAPITIGADEDAEQVLALMARHGVRRLPVVDGEDLVGMVSQADVAQHLPEQRIGDMVEAISAAPPNN